MPDSVNVWVESVWVLVTMPTNDSAVIVKDPQGRQVAVGALHFGPAGGDDITCVMPFSVPGVPLGLPSYSLTISHRGTEDYTPREARAGVKLECCGVAATSRP